MSGRREADDPEALALLAELDDLTDQARRIATEADDVMAARNRCFVRLKELRVTHREIAAHSDLTEMAVKKAIDKTLREMANT